MKRAKKKKTCPCVALEMDENACDGCDKFESENKLLDKIKSCIVKIFDALTEKRRQTNDHR